MKKRISMLLVILMLCSLCASSWAEEEVLPNETEAVAYAGCGVAFTLPEGMRNLRGTLVHENTSVVDGVFCTDLFYFAMPRERYEQLERRVIVDQAGTDEEIGEYFGSGCSVCSIYCVDGGRDFSAVTDAYREAFDADPGFDGEKAAKLAQIGEYSFYLYKTNEPEQAAGLVSDAYADELAGVLSGIDELVEAMVFTKPSPLLAEKYAPAVKLLEQINGAAPALDTESESAATDAEEAAPPEEAAAEPVGEVAAEPVEEAAAEAVAEEPAAEPAETEPAGEEPAPAEEAAAEETTPAEETAPAEETTPAEEAAEEEEASGPVPNELRVYRVFVRDDEGPVEGVTVQFCSDAACLIGKTNADGCASFDQPSGLVYTVHILKTPKGYEKDKTEYATLNVYSDLEIVIARTAE